MTDREKLIELFKKIKYKPLPSATEFDFATQFTEYGLNCIVDELLASGVIVTPCFAMVEQFIKDGKFDKKHTAHNGRFAVVYIDESKWKGCPLIDITEQFYNTEKAEERIQVLKELQNAETKKP